MSSSINLHCMNPRVHSENVPEPPPATAISLSEKTQYCIGKYIIAPSLILVPLCGLISIIYVAITFDDWEPFATFKVESLSLVSPYNKSEEHWNIALRVGNPRPNTEYPINLSYNVSHVYLSLYGQLIGIGDMPAFDVLKQKEILMNRTLNAVLSHPEDKILHDLENLWLTIVVPVAEVDRTLLVSCLSFQNISSSAMQGIRMRSRKCLTRFYPSPDEE